MKQILFSVLILLVSQFSHGQTDSIKYSFFVAGHTYGQPGVNNVGFHPPFRSKFDYIKGRDEIEFGVLTGDIAGPNPTTIDWREIDSSIDTLGLPVYFAVGNHDVINRIVFETRYGNTFYEFSLNNDLFIVLDPNISNWNISTDQLKFVENILKEKKDSVNNIFLFFHQLLWVNDHNLFRNIRMNSTEGRARSINFWSEFLPLFDNVKNPIVFFAGDLGAGSWSDDVMYYVLQNKTFIASGMGEGIGDNFIVVNVWSNNALTFDLIPLVEGDSAILGQLSDHLVVEPKIELKIFPNPTSDYVRLQLSNLGIFSRMNINDLNGRTIYSSSEYKSSINITNIPDGIYFIEVEYQNTLYYEKLVKCKDC